MDLLSGINLYTMQSSQIKNTMKKVLSGEDVVENKEITEQKTINMPSEDIFNFMSYQAIPVRVDISKNIKIQKITESVSVEQYNRISDIMKDFENTFQQGMDYIDEDFQNFNISENTKVKIVSESFKKTFF